MTDSTYSMVVPFSSRLYASQSLQNLHLIIFISDLMLFIFLPFALLFEFQGTVNMPWFQWAGLTIFGKILAETT